MLNGFERILNRCTILLWPAGLGVEQPDALSGRTVHDMVADVFQSVWLWIFRIVLVLMKSAAKAFGHAARLIPYI
jgi:hypothetical protein